ncbi:MAG: PAC2 family protein [Candidatus Heimdallarchaeota archaeon]|nr:PAC2 family protein [Candidatus Heimdallarchaeota archaeon]
MSSDLEIKLFKEDIKFHDSLIITTFGGVSGIVGDYLIEHLKLEYIGAIFTELAFCGCEIRNGQPLAPIQIYSGEYKDIANTDFDQIVLITTKFNNSEDLDYPLSIKILEWAKEINASAVLTMTPLYRKEMEIGSPVNVYHVLSDSTLEKYSSSLRSQPFLIGSLSGFPGSVLYIGKSMNVPVITLISEVHPDFRDSRAAAAILETINQFVPEIEMDHEPLLREAEEIESQIIAHLESMQGGGGGDSSFA